MRNIKTIKKTIDSTKEEFIEIKRLVPNRWNFNEQPPYIFSAVVESIRRYGNKLYPVIVRTVGKAKLEIIDGEHRWKACLKLGYDKLWVKNIGKVDINSAEELTLLLNETRGESDLLKLSKAMGTISEAYPLEEIMKRYPFTGAELRDMAIFKDINWDDFPDEWESMRDPTKVGSGRKVCDHNFEIIEAYVCLQCGIVVSLEDERINESKQSVDVKDSEKVS